MCMCGRGEYRIHIPRRCDTQRTTVVVYAARRSRAAKTLRRSMSEAMWYIVFPRSLVSLSTRWRVGDHDEISTYTCRGDLETPSPSNSASRFFFLRDSCVCLLFAIIAGKWEELTCCGRCASFSVLCVLNPSCDFT